jgi:hypothetical protein
MVNSSLDRVVVDDLAGGLPVREFRWYKGRQHYSGWYWSATTQRMVIYESRLELARVLLADFDRSVVAVAAQPLQLTGSDEDRVRRHVPDLLLVHRNGAVTIVDVKPARKREDAQVQALMAWTRDVVALRGWGFEAWYGAPHTLLANVSFLAGYRRDWVVEQGLIPSVLAAVGPGSSIVDAERALRPVEEARVRPVVLHLIWRGLLTANLEHPLDGLTVVVPGEAVEAVA